MATSETEAEAWLRQVLATRALGENAIRSALKAAGIPVEDSTVQSLLRRWFLQQPDGRWTVGGSVTPPPPAMTTATARATDSVRDLGSDLRPRTLSLIGLVELLNASRQLVEASLYYVQRTSPNSTWPAIRNRLRAGGMVELTALQVSDIESTVERFRSEFSTSVSVKVALDSKRFVKDGPPSNSGTEAPDNAALPSVVPAVAHDGIGETKDAEPTREHAEAFAAMERVLAEERAAAARSERELQEERRRRQEVESASRAQEEELRVLRVEQEKRSLDATRAREQTRHLRSRLEDTAHSNPDELERLRKLLTEKENEVKHLEGRVQASSEVITTYLAKERQARATARGAAQQPPPRAGKPAVRKRRSWEPLAGGGYFFAAAEATTVGEEQLFARPWPTGWLVVGNPTITQGTRTRETDALVITPRGIVVIEQKDTQRSGDLWFPPNGPPTIDGIAVDSLDGALQQARLPAQLLASLCKNEDFNPGYVESVLSIWGDINFTQTRQNQIHLCRTDAVVDTLEHVLGRRSDPLAIATIEWLLPNLGLALDGLPSWTELGYAA